MEKNGCLIHYLFSTSGPPRLNCLTLTPDDDVWSCWHFHLAEPSCRHFPGGTLNQASGSKSQQIVGERSELRVCCFSTLICSFFKVISYDRVLEMGRMAPVALSLLLFAESFFFYLSPLLTASSSPLISVARLFLMSLTSKLASCSQPGMR